MRYAALALLILSGCVRNVNAGREQNITYDEPTDIQLGIQGFQEALGRSTVSTNAADLEAVRRVWKRLVVVARKLGYRWQIEVLASDGTEAWCLPGGKAAVSAGCLGILKDDAGAAFLLGHIAAHALQRHGAERLSREFEREEIDQVVLAPLGEEWTASRTRILGCYGVPVGDPPPFDARQESEADRLALELMARAGYDPRQAALVLGRLEAAGSPALLAMHPTSVGRLKELESRRPSADALYDQAAKAPAGTMPERKTGGSPESPAAPAGSVVLTPAGHLRTTTKDHRPALLLEFWLNEDVFLDRGQVSGPGGFDSTVPARVGIPAHSKKQAFVVRPDGGAGDLPGGAYTLTLKGSASGRIFTVSCAYEVR